MKSSSLQDQVYDWLARHYPEGPEWDKDGFHCFQDCAQIVRRLLAMDAVEGEISNGAWGQLLWNTFPNWRVVLDLARDGYESMGADGQVDAIPHLHAKLSEYESACDDARRRAEQGNFAQEFGAFTSIGYSDTSFKPQFAFLDEQLGALREAWLSRHRQEVLNAIGT